MDLATALIWTLRIVLPIILFCIYFKLQSPKDEQWPGPTKHSYPRQTLLDHRKVTLANGGPVPESMETLQLVDVTQAPALFVTPSRGRRGGAGAPRGDDRAPKERRERRETGEAKKPPVEKLPEPVEAVEAPEPEGVSNSEEKMHLESLLNYVAFNRKEQQRTFLPDEAGAPPPPPPRPKKTGGANTTDSGAVAEVVGSKSLDPVPVSSATAEKANADAQMVLKGAINVKRGEVAKDLYEQLVDSQVEISERTFTLMIEACVLARDLKSASDFLMKMESSGYCPNTELLDKVMDLYSQQKIAREHEKHEKKHQPGESVENTAGDMPGMSMGNDSMEAFPDVGQELSTDDLIKGMRAKLSSQAPVFVPMLGGPSALGIPPPPPPPQMPEEDFTDEDKDMSLTLRRTALKASAAPFEPQGTVTFDPYKYTWTVDNSKGEKKAPEQYKGEKKGRGGKKGGEPGEPEDPEALEMPKGTEEDGKDQTGKKPQAKGTKAKPKYRPKAEAKKED